jgi:hypothetical protein
MQRHRNDQDLPLLKARLQNRDRFGQHPAEDVGCGADAAVLQKMNQLAESPFIAAVRDGPGEGQLDAATNRADQRLAGLGASISREHALAANGADLATQGQHVFDAALAHGKPGNPDQRRAAKAAVGGKKHREETLGSAAGPRESDGGRRLRNNTRPGHCKTGLASPDSVLTTAEDGLLARPLAGFVARSYWARS